MTEEPDGSVVRLLARLKNPVDSRMLGRQTSRDEHFSRIARILKDVHAEYAKPLSVKELARKAGKPTMGKTLTLRRERLGKEFFAVQPRVQTSLWCYTHRGSRTDADPNGGWLMEDRTIIGERFKEQQKKEIRRRTSACGRLRRRRPSSRSIDRDKVTWRCRVSFQ
jgi:hypothetical protein